MDNIMTSNTLSLQTYIILQLAKGSWSGVIIQDFYEKDHKAIDFFKKLL